SQGSSTPSVATPPDSPWGHGGGLAWHPRQMQILPGHGLVRVVWYSPTNTKHNPAVAYQVTISNGQQYTVTSLRAIITTQDGGRLIGVFGGLTRGQRYRVSIAAVTPVGVGQAGMTSWVTAT
ncbi:MAG TPA: hypothetical protein VG815_04350, partial [Chloroflexota bacterium]|nr:hypothetical protein [Chloroflexota bacterium]